MIEIKRYGLFQRLYFILFCLYVYGIVLWFSILLVYEQRFLTAILLLFFSLLFTSFLYLFRRHMNKHVIRVEMEDNLYHLTLVNKKKFSLDPESVVKIWRSERLYILVLDNGKKFYLPKVYKWFTPVDPWKPLLTQSRFPNAEFKYTFFLW